MSKVVVPHVRGYLHEAKHFFFLSVWVGAGSIYMVSKDCGALKTIGTKAHKYPAGTLKIQDQDHSLTDPLQHNLK